MITFLMFLLPLINITVGTLLLTGKLRLVVVRPVQTPDLALVTTVETPKKKRGRPRKDGTTTVKTHHLHLPHGTDSAQVQDIYGFFKEHRYTSGDRVILHYTTDGIERTSEVPVLVHWNSDLKEELNTVLGWA